MADEIFSSVFEIVLEIFQNAEKLLVLTLVRRETYLQHVQKCRV